MADSTFPWHAAAIMGVHNTEQARSLPGHTSRTITAEAIRGAVADAGLTIDEIDGISAGTLTEELLYDLALGPAWTGAPSPHPILSLFECVAAIAAGAASAVVLAGGNAGVYTDRAAAAPWTRPHNEFVADWGLFTAAEFALLARTHMDRFGTTPEHLAAVAATIRNNGHVNPDAVYHGRGPFTTSDILESRMIAESVPPPGLLDDVRGRLRARSGAGRPGSRFSPNRLCSSSAWATTDSGRPTCMPPRGTSRADVRSRRTGSWGVAPPPSR